MQHRPKCTWEWSLTLALAEVVFSKLLHIVNVFDRMAKGKIKIEIMEQAWLSQGTLQAKTVRNQIQILSDGYQYKIWFLLSLKQD